MQTRESPIQKPVDLLRMMRLPNCIMIGFAVVVGEVIGSQTISGRAVFYGFMTGFFLLASSMVLNDYFDREIDKINALRRPMAIGNVKPAEAISFAVVLASLGLYFAANLGVWTLAIASTSVVIMVLYNARIKKLGLLGNALVSLNVAIPFVFGGLAVGSLTWSLGIFALLAFLSSLGREVIKGIVDVKGDSVKGVRTVAAIMGNAAAANRAAALFLGAVILSAVPIILGLVSIYYIPLVVICDIGFVLTAYSIRSAPTPSNAKRNKSFILVWMIFGLLAFVLGAA